MQVRRTAQNLMTLGPRLHISYYLDYQRVAHRANNLVAKSAKKSQMGCRNYVGANVY